MTPVCTSRARCQVRARSPAGGGAGNRAGRGRAGRNGALQWALRRNGTGITADGEFHMPTHVLFGRGVCRTGSCVAGHRRAGRDALVRIEDLDLLGDKAAQNTSRPSNPRDADAAAFRDMFARELSRSS